MWEERIKTHRQALHQIPEIGFQEHQTKAYIEKVFASLPRFQLFSPYETSVVAVLEGGKDALLFRSDMDGLPIQEENELSFCSQTPGMMHACGHDGHMAILLCFGEWLHQRTFDKTMILVFQPAEESPGGAKGMIETGFFDSYNILGAFGLHLWPDLKRGKIATKKGPFMAQPTEFDVTIQGRAGHGAKPHQNIDATLIGAELLQEYQSIISREVNPLDPCVLTVGKMVSGTVRNIISGSCRLEGTIRSFSEEVMAKIIQAMKKCHLSKELRWNCQIQSDFRISYPPVINTDSWVESLSSLVPPEMIEFCDASMIAEDFSYFLNAFSGAFFFLGVKEENMPNYALHHPKFQFQESSLLTGLWVYQQLVSPYETDK